MKIFNSAKLRGARTVLVVLQDQRNVSLREEIVDRSFNSVERAWLAVGKQLREAIVNDRRERDREAARATG